MLEALTSNRLPERRQSWRWGAAVLFAVSVSMGLSACAGDVGDWIVDCEAHGGVEPFCGFSNPEDLVYFAPTGNLIASQFGSLDGSAPGTLASFLPDQPLPLILYPGPEADADVPEPGWGSADCPGPPGPAFSPHGLDLIERGDGRHALLVINHGERESVEYFELLSGADDAVDLSWRGCVILPEPLLLNDLVALADGGFWATHMYSRDAEISSVLKALFGTDTGWVVEWRPDSGFAEVPGTRAPMPNGIARCAEERHIYLNAYFGGEVRRIDVESGEVLATLEVPHPDNLTWADDGRLLVASHRAGVRQIAGCRDGTEGTCALAFSILALDPEDLTAEVLLERDDVPTGAVSVALQVGEHIWLGTFAGDRVARMAFPSGY
ncbi:MAG: hypothetical protein JJU22_05100 [Gammaproteobacteria bacterium]|nr:hypothetical protein [Gammaproteobacteria bacterium]